MGSTSEGRSSTAHSLLVLRIADGEVFKVTDEATNVWSPSWSPDGRKLYFVSNHAGSMDLWQQPMGEDGRPEGDPQPVTIGLGIRSAAFSYDRQQLAYSKGRRVTNLWRVPILADRAATWADAKQVTFDQAFIEFIDVSPDGQYLLFDSDRLGNADLWKLRIEEGEMQQLTSDPAADWDPRWSPDGKEVVFYSDRSGNRDIWIMPASGGPARQLTHDEATELFPAWSPNGREIAFSSWKVRGEHDIWVIPAEGGDPRRVTRGSRPEWSPDGRWLAFSRDGRVWRIRSQGGEAEQLTQGPGSKQRWTPDGERIYFKGRREPSRNLWELRLKGRSERPVTDLVGRYGSLGGHGLATGGTYLYFTWEQALGDIWVMDVVTDEDQ